ncbi:MAG: hypothetical protein M1832_002540 [Thelocarpon impressellum]|nr:MAG: hypothetical protein M1832_002540 [Thelocarpon impressellum]
MSTSYVIFLCNHKHPKIIPTFKNLPVHVARLCKPCTAQRLGIAVFELRRAYCEILEPFESCLKTVLEWEKESEGDETLLSIAQTLEEKMHLLKVQREEKLLVMCNDFGINGDFL